MPFYLRRSISAGPFRFNLSKSGVGVSVGVKGFRVGTSPRGSYVHMGLGGVYYRALLSPAAKRERPASTVNFVEAAQPVSDGLTEIESGPVALMAPASAQELLTQIAEAHARRRRAPIVAVLTACAMALSLFYAVPVAFVVAAGIGGILFLLACRVDAANKAVLVYDLEPSAAEAFQRLCSSFDALLAASNVWHIEAAGRTTDWKRNAGASGLVRRKDARPSYAAPAAVATNLDVPTFAVGKQQLYFFPDRILVFEGSTAGAVEYAQLRMDARPTNFIEEDRVPADSPVVGSTWRYVNKSGGPDRRFNNNRQLPIWLYEELHFGSASGLRELIHVSRPGAAVGFAAHTFDYVQHLRAPSAQPTEDAHARALALGFSSLPQATSETRPRFTWPLRKAAAWLVLLAIVGMWLADRAAKPTLTPGVEMPVTIATAKPQPTGQETKTPSSDFRVPAPPPSRPITTDAKPEPVIAALPQPALLEPPPQEALYTTARVNLRASPAASGRLVAVIDKGLEVEVLETSGDWRKVRVGSFEGWVAGRLVSPNSPVQRTRIR